MAGAGSAHDGDLGRSGPKRLGNGRCGVALTTPSRDEASIAVPHPQVGRCLSTLVNLVLELGVKFAGDLLEDYARTVTGVFRPGITQPTTKSCKQHEHAKLNFVAVRYFGIINLPRKNQWDN